MRLVAKAVLWLHSTLYRLTNGRIGGRSSAGKPQPGRPVGRRGTSASATADAKCRPDEQKRGHSEHNFLDRPSALASEQHEVEQHEERDDYQEDGTHQRVHSGDPNRLFRRRERQPAWADEIRHCRAPSERLPTRQVPKPRCRARGCGQPTRPSWGEEWPSTLVPLAEC
jgi:hypothetical protein